MNKRNSILILLSFIFSIAAFTTCTINYGFTGAVPMVGVKTFSVAYFQNRARLINPNLSQQKIDLLAEDRCNFLLYG